MTKFAETFEKLEVPSSPGLQKLDSSPSSPGPQHDSPVNVQLTSSRQIKLDVGGYKFATTLTTLTSDPNSMLAAMFSGRFTVEKNEEGCVFVDRDGKTFHHVLNWLRNATLPALDSAAEHDALLIEAKFYQIGSLITFLNDTRAAEESQNKETKDHKFTSKELLELINSVPSKKKVQLASADLSGLCLNGFSLPAANLKYVNLENTSMQRANLQEVSLEYSNLNGADLQHSDLSLGNFHNCTFRNATLANSNLQGAILLNADMTGCDLQNTNLMGANLQNANLQGANLQNTNLTGAKLQGASLHGILNVQYAKGLKR